MSKLWNRSWDKGDIVAYWVPRFKWFNHWRSHTVDWVICVTSVFTTNPAHQQIFCCLFLVLVTLLYVVILITCFCYCTRKSEGDSGGGSKDQAQKRKRETECDCKLIKICIVIYFVYISMGICSSVCLFSTIQQIWTKFSRRPLYTLQDYAGVLRGTTPCNQTQYLTGSKLLLVCWVRGENWCDTDHSVNGMRPSMIKPLETRNSVCHYVPFYLKTYSTVCSFYPHDVTLDLCTLVSRLPRSVPMLHLGLASALHCFIIITIIRNDGFNMP